MNRSLSELDDIRHQLDTTLQTFGKPGVTDRVFAGWLDALEPFATDDIVQMLKSYVCENEWAPKPKNIVDLCRRDRDRNRGLSGLEDTTVKADAQVAQAWVICLRRFYGFRLADLQTEDEDPDGLAAFEAALNGVAVEPPPEVEMDFETALQIVNREAAKYDNPDAVPDAYKLPEFWDKPPPRGQQGTIDF